MEAEVQNIEIAKNSVKNNRVSPTLSIGNLFFTNTSAPIIRPSHPKRTVAAVLNGRPKAHSAQHILPALCENPDFFDN